MCRSQCCIIRQYCGGGNIKQSNITSTEQTTIISFSPVDTAFKKETNHVAIIATGHEMWFILYTQHRFATLLREMHNRMRERKINRDRAMLETDNIGKMCTIFLVPIRDSSSCSHFDRYSSDIRVCSVS